MTLRKSILPLLLPVIAICCVVGAQTVLAQSTDQPSQTKKAEDLTNLDTQLYLIVGTNQEVADGKMPAVLDTVIKQLRSTLPFKNYKLSATLINRVRNEGRLSLKWIGGPLLGSGAATTETPSFHDFKVNSVSLVDGPEGQQLVRMEGFGFGSRIPVQTGTAIASNAPAAPIINYEPTGLTTDISMREGEPVVVGTMNVGLAGEAIILVMSARRTR